MKKLIVASLLSLSPFAIASSDVVVDLKAVACDHQTHPGIEFTSKGLYFLNVWNNTDIPQPVSIVYNHCVDGGGCMEGQDTHVVEPHSLWSHEWQTHLPHCKYGIGTYTIDAQMDVRVDLSGQHYYATSRNFISST